MGWDNFDLFSERKSTKLDRKQGINVLRRVFVFLGRLEKQDGCSCLICWDILDFSSEIAKRNSMKLEIREFSTWIEELSNSIVSSLIELVSSYSFGGLSNSIRELSNSIGELYNSIEELSN